MGRTDQQIRGEIDDNDNDDDDDDTNEYTELDNVDDIERHFWFNKRTMWCSYVNDRYDKYPHHNRYKRYTHSRLGRMTIE